MLRPASDILLWTQRRAKKGRPTIRNGTQIKEEGRHETHKVDLKFIFPTVHSKRSSTHPIYIGTSGRETTRAMPIHNDDRDLSSTPSLLPSSPLSSASSRLPSPQCLPSPPSSPSPPHQRRHERRDKTNESVAYVLRSHNRKQVPKSESPTYTSEDLPQSRSSPASNFDALQPPKAGRLQKWQAEILQDIFDHGIWSPGDYTLEALKASLKNRFKPPFLSQTKWFY